MVTRTLTTVEEFIPLLESDDARHELVEGEIITLSPTMPLHNLVRDNLLVLLKTFLKERNLGVVLSEQAFVVSEHTVRIPDIAVISEGRLARLDEIPEGAPDLAVEIISPSNTLREMERKVSDYFAAGSKRVWLIYPEEREVYIHGASGVARKSGDDLLNDAELLPGFSVIVANLFE